MNQVQLFTSGIFGSVRAINIDEKAWFVATDVANSLGYKNKSDAISRHCKGVVKRSILTSGGVQEVNLINDNDVIHLTEKSRVTTESNKEEFLQLLNIIRNDHILLSSRKEIEFLTTLEEQLTVFGIAQFERQYSNLKCGNYKIDLYIPELNVAVEYDENGHQHYTYEHQGLRQKLIEEELGCRFIRVSDDKSHVENSAIVLRELMKLNLLN